MKHKSLVISILAVAGLSVFGSQDCAAQGQVTTSGKVTTSGRVVMGGGSVKRHPKEVLHYQVKFEGGDTAKVTEAGLNFRSEDPIPADQPGLTNRFGGSCTKATADSAVLECAATIPDNIANGNYRLNIVNAIAGPLSKGYDEDFHVPLVPIENPQTFNPPTKVVVTPKP